ncbi:MAG: two-component sensor histidine kinase [Hyphomicrobiales bacterium]|nr:MAG: two-component sensor histidine kinase [Hyphomicrobiales bacterium]
MLALISLELATNYLLDDLAQRARTTLGITIAGLKGALGRYRSIPQLIADNPGIRALLLAPASPRLVRAANLELKRINAAVQASDVYVMNVSGLTLASSNYELKTSFVGQNFSYRPYFQDAVSGGLGRYFALGTTSLKRGYYFASPVRADGRIIGVVAVKVDIDQLEQSWQSKDQVIAVTDEHGIIFMSSRPDLLFNSLRPLSEASRRAIRASRKYNEAELRELDLSPQGSTQSGLALVAVPAGGKPAEYLMQSRPMPAEGWDIQILSRTGAARTQAYIFSSAVLLVLLSTMLAAAFLVLRRQQLLERMRNQSEVQEELERRVKARTTELDETNARLLEEINERKSAEEELRKTQADLVQAGKLAALGQMSAALSHEFNQPLGAAKSYADNAVAFIDRGRIDEARENIDRISMLVGRMGAISRHLRNFARKPNVELTTVPVATIINDALEILDRRIRALNIKVRLDLPPDELWVLGGQVRLQQVLVNLINNAIDAMEAVYEPEVVISAAATGRKICLSVRDRGPGIPEEIAERIFDPFFTTRGVGKGLGLGLSISYNIIRDFGGHLQAHNHEGGGAEFRIMLKSAVNEPQKVQP